jgi:rubrerythrin
MEDDHVITFSDMKKELTDKETTTGFDPDDENISYLKALADTRVFFKKEQPDDSFQGILSTAIQTEKDSIAFYLGMKELVPAKLGKTKIDDIIKEEMSHIKILAEKLFEK